MSEANRQLTRWWKTRKLGRRRFIIWYGILGWGLSSGLIWAVLMRLWFPDRPFWPWLVIAVLLFPVAGYFWGVAMWWWKEKAFRGRV